MKRILLILISLVPFIIGIGVEKFLINRGIVGFPILLIGLIVISGWFIYGLTTCYAGINKLQGFVLGNLFGILSLILLLFQSLILRKFIDGYVGLFSQYYSMPIVRVIVEVDFLNMIKAAHLVMIISHICLLAIFAIGYKVAERKWNTEIVA